MTQNHTEGPWIALNGKYSWQIHSVDDKRKMRHWIAAIKCESCPANEEGNAHLIAAAPELLAALEWVESTGMCEHGGGGEMIRNAIAKARGQV